MKTPILFLESKLRLSAAMMAISILVAAQSAADIPPNGTSLKAVDPIALYGQEIRFDVLRDGDKLGQHVVRFGRRDDMLTVDVRFELRYRLLAITLYSYTYTAEARWRGGRLITLNARTDDDGDISTVSVRADDDGLVIDGPNGTTRADPALFPTHHWHAGVVEANRVVNTITGKVNDVAIARVNRQSVALADGRVVADHYVYTGDIRNEVWYDHAGRWVKMRFKARDGSIVEYVCRSCSALPATAGADHDP